MSVANETAKQKALDTLTHYIKLGYEAAGKEWQDDMTLEWRCGCGKVTTWADAHPSSPNPYAMPMCGDCLEREMQDAERRRKEPAMENLSPDILQEARRMETVIATAIADLRHFKEQHPALKVGHYEGNPGSILNAYREGDLTFDEAVKALTPADGTWAWALRVMADIPGKRVALPDWPAESWLEISDYQPFQLVIHNEFGYHRSVNVEVNWFTRCDWQVR